MKKGRHRRFEEARALKQVSLGERPSADAEPCPECNAAPGADTIEFAIGSGPQTILLGSDLPTITDTVVIDGNTQPGFSGSPLVELTNGTGFVTKGLYLASAGAAEWARRFGPDTVLLVGSSLYAQRDLRAAAGVCGRC